MRSPFHQSLIFRLPPLVLDNSMARHFLQDMASFTAKDFLSLWRGLVKEVGGGAKSDLDSSCCHTEPPIKPRCSWSDSIPFITQMRIVVASGLGRDPTLPQRLSTMWDRIINWCGRCFAFFICP